MELGATVCTPRNPRCDACPLFAVCRGRSDPLRYGKKQRRTKVIPVRAVAGLCRHGGGWLLGRRPPGSLLPGLWEPVGAPLEGDASPTAVLKEAFLKRAGVVVAIGDSLGEVQHVFSHRRLTTQVFAVSVVSGDPKLGPPYTDLQWPPEPGELALSKLAQKVLALDPSHR